MKGKKEHCVQRNLLVGGGEKGFACGKRGNIDENLTALKEGEKRGGGGKGNCSRDASLSGRRKNE